MDDKNQDQTKDKPESKTPEPKTENKETEIENQSSQEVSKESSTLERADKKQTENPKKETDKKSRLKSKPVIIALSISLFVVIFLFLILLVLGGGSSEDQTARDTQLSVTPAPRINSTSSPELIPQTKSSNEDNEFKTFRSDKLLGIDFPGFLITYPISWTFQNQRLDSIPSSKVILKKNNYTLIVEQSGDLENRICLYKGDFEPEEVNYIDLREFIFKEIETNFGEIRRTEDKSLGFTKYTYCQIQELRYYENPLKLGMISINGPLIPNSEIFKEAEEIIKSIEIL